MDRPKPLSVVLAIRARYLLLWTIRGGTGGRHPWPGFQHRRGLLCTGGRLPPRSELTGMHRGGVVSMHNGEGVVAWGEWAPMEHEISALGPPLGPSHEPGLYLQCYLSLGGTFPGLTNWGRILVHRSCLAVCHCRPLPSLTSWRCISVLLVSLLPSSFDTSPLGLRPYHRPRVCKSSLSHQFPHPGEAGRRRRRQ